MPSPASAARALIPLLPPALAAWLAAWGLNFGLPFLFRPDEDVMVGRAVRMALEGTVDPAFYNYPPLVFDLFALAERLLAVIPDGGLGPATQSDPTGEYLVARGVSALAFVAAVILTERAGRAMYGRAAGLTAGVVLAVSPLAVRQAHFATVDMVQMALVAAALLATTRMNDRRGCLMAGVVCGLAAATKYTGGMTALPAVLIALKEPSDRAWRMVCLLGGIMVGAGLPFLPVLSHLHDYVGGLGFLFGRSRGSYGLLGLIVHPTQSLPLGLGPMAFLASLAGAALALRRRSMYDVVLLLFTAVYLASLAPSQEAFFRYVLPLLPALALLAGACLRDAGPLTTGRWRVASLVVVVLVPSLAASAAQDVLLTQVDTRVQAAAWLEENAPPGSSIGVASYWGEPFYGAEDLPSNPLHPLYVTVDPLPDTFQQGRFTTRFRILPIAEACYRIYESGPPDQAPLPSTPMPPTVTFLPYRGSAPAGAIYDRLDSFYLPIWGFAGVSRPGPAVAIVRIC